MVFRSGEFSFMSRKMRDLLPVLAMTLKEIYKVILIFDGVQIYSNYKMLGGKSNHPHSPGPTDGPNGLELGTGCA